MAKTRQALGRGLSALIPDIPPPPQARERPTEVDLDRLTPNRFQPRTVMDASKLEELSRSIRSSGVIQPIVVRRLNADAFEIVAGERRWRAAQQAGLLRVPVVVRDVADDKLLELALIENLQRENLNPIEEAEAYRRLIDDHQLTQEQVGGRRRKGPCDRRQLHPPARPAVRGAGGRVGRRARHGARARLAWAGRADGAAPCGPARL